MKWAGLVTYTEKTKIHVNVLTENLNGRDHLGYLGVYITLQWIFEKQGEGVHWIQLA
jgi:hypothetical protein